MPGSAALEEGVDRKQLRLALNRFRAISAARLERVRAMLGERQRLFIDLLPLLLHANHPGLPGYVSQQTPCGITGYTPGSAVLALARRVSLSFSYQRPPESEAQVHAVYLMGSSGTLGHSDGSDLDVWICYPETLASAELELLQRKSTQLQRWARENGVEAHLFLMNGEKFKRGQREPLTGENCGTAQHYLLLDEFYRTGILLAGRLPAWWLVPPPAEAHYAEYCRRLTQKRYVRSAEIVDFGGIDTVPEGEFVGAGIWQLYKAIDSPYKSVLKLLLFEVYAADLPRANCLSGDYKRAVYAGQSRIDDLDPYVMIYRRIERHLLEREEPERLEIVRRCLYYKAGKKLSRPPQAGGPSWQRLLMERLCDEWGWERDKLALLDSRSEWNIHDVGAERNELVKELTYSYRFLSEFARRSAAGASIDAREFSILGRKLYAAYERKAGKIESVNPGRAHNVVEGELSVCAAHPREPGAEPQWMALPGIVAPRAEPAGRVLREAGCLSELLAWCVLNGVISERTRLASREALDGLRHAELRRMVADLEELVRASTSAEQTDDDAFAAPAEPLRMLVFVNVAADPLRHHREVGLQRVTSRTDSLEFSALRENLVVNVETVLGNSWGEIVATRYAGEDGLVRCLRDYLQLIARGAARPALTIRSYCASRAEAIAARITELFEDLGQCFGRAAPDGDMRYVLAVGNRLHLVEMCEGEVSSSAAGDEAGLVQILGRARRRWCPLGVDRYALHGSVLRAIASYMEPGRVTVFLENIGNRLSLGVVDENGTLFATTYDDALEGPALCAIDQFLAAVRYRQNSSAAPGAANAAPLYLRLSRNAARGEYGVSRITLPAGRRSVPFLDVQAIAEAGDGTGPLYTVYCNGVAFSQRGLGAQFATRLAEHVYASRRAGGEYPVYLTDIDLSALAPGARGALASAACLAHKRRLEQSVQDALREAPMPRSRGL